MPHLPRMTWPFRPTHIRAAERQQNVATAAGRGIRVMRMSAEGATDSLTLSPLQGFLLKRHLSTACGRGYTMPPLRGSLDSVPEGEGSPTHMAVIR